MAVNDRVRDVVTAAVDPTLVVYDIEHHAGVLRVTLDAAGGIDVDRLADANRAISRALDEADPIPGRYSLEVTSPGLERTLRTLQHWSGAVGEQVKVKLRSGIEGERRLEGVVNSVSDSGVAIGLVDGSERHVALDEVERARTVFEWGPAPKPGGPKRTANPSSATRTKEAQT